MDILLIRHPVESASLRYPGGPRFGAPLSILYLAAVCEKAGHDARIYDALVDFEWDGIERTADGGYHVGASWERIGRTIAGINPSVIGITNPFSDFAHLAAKTAAVARKACPGAAIVVGGPHASVCPEYFLSDTSVIDYVVQGEGEQVFIDLLDAIASGGEPAAIAGVCCRRGSGVRVNLHGPFIAQLDTLPLPAYHLVDMQRYFTLAADGFPSRFGFEYPGSQRECSIITSRGCPFRCVFCGNHLHMGYRWRFHSAAYVLRHMRMLVEKYDVRHFHLEDDNITLDPARFEAILDGIIGEGWQITWDTPNGIRAEGLGDSLVRKARASGCTYLVIGVESGDQQVLESIVRKHLRLEDVERALSACRRARLDTHAFYVVGFPGETTARIHRTFAFARRMLWQYDTMPHLGLARPLPGTDLHRISSEQGYLTAPVRPDIGAGLRGEVFERVMIATPEFTPARLERWVRRFNRTVMAIALCKIAVWCITHPRAWPSIVRKIKSDRRRRVPALVSRLFFGGLFYKFNFERVLPNRTPES